MTKPRNIRRFPPALPNGAHISSAGAEQPIKPRHKVNITTRPTVTVAWRCYQDTILCWQQVTVNGQTVFIACDQLQTGIAAQQMAQSICAYSEQEADEMAKKLVEDAIAKQQAQQPQPTLLRVWRPGDPG